MSMIPANPGVFHWVAPRPHPSGSFRPNGRMEFRGIRVNPEGWSSKRTLAARIVVGFNVGTEPRWTMDDLIPIVERVRRKQVGDPSSTFVAQKGIYQHRDGKTVVHEDGAQIIIIDLQDSKKKKFKRQMVTLAETIARELEQEQVIVEIQKNGLSEETIGVIP